MDKNGNWNEDDYLAAVEETNVIMRLGNIGRMCEDLEVALHIISKGEDIEDAKNGISHVHDYLLGIYRGAVKAHFARSGELPESSASVPQNVLSFDAFVDSLNKKEDEDEE